MTHDFAKQKKTGKQNKKKAFPMPPWLLLVVGIAIGLFANLLFKLNDMGSIKDPKELISAAEKFKNSASLEAKKFQPSRDNKSNNTDGPDEFTGCHILMYNGVEPTRQKIKNCEYEFWAAQHVYYMPACFSGPLETLRASMETYSSKAENLDKLPDSFKFYWAAQEEMECEKVPLVINKKDRIDRK